MPCAYTHFADEDQHTKLLWARGQYDDDMDEAHKAVQGALYVVLSSLLHFWNVLLKKLSHSEVKGPET